MQYGLDKYLIIVKVPKMEADIRVELKEKNFMHYILPYDI